MPSLNSFMMIEESKRRFRSFQLRAAAASGAGAGIPTAFKPPVPGAVSFASDKSMIPPSQLPQTAVPLPMPPALFRAASNSAQDVANQKQYNQEFADFIDGICRALCQAHDQWRRIAFFRDVTINAVTAVGGNLEGPGLQPFIISIAPMTGALGWAQQYSGAIAAGIQDRWNDFQHSITVPGLPWYPSFAMLPMPVAPPTPNVPTPLAACQNNPFMIETAMIRDTIKRKLGAPGPFSDQLFEAIAAGFSQAVRMWLPIQMITQVKGTGPVPTFAPPAVPGGPVVNGSIIPEPGHLAA
jgi:hypothetical protein